MAKGKAKGKAKKGAEPVEAEAEAAAPAGEKPAKAEKAGKAGKGDKKSGASEKPAKAAKGKENAAAGEEKPAKGKKGKGKKGAEKIVHAPMTGHAWESIVRSGGAGVLDDEFVGDAALAVMVGDLVGDYEEAGLLDEAEVQEPHLASDVFLDWNDREVLEERARRRAAAKISVFTLGFALRRVFARKRRAAVRIQSVWRGHSLRDTLWRQKANAAAIRIQAHVRMILAKRLSKRKKLRRIVIVQSLWRMQSARKMVDVKRTEARKLRATLSMQKIYRKAKDQSLKMADMLQKLADAVLRPPGQHVDIEQGSRRFVPKLTDIYCTTAADLEGLVTEVDFKHASVHFTAPRPETGAVTLPPIGNRKRHRESARRYKELPQWENRLNRSVDEYVAEQGLDPFGGLSYSINPATGELFLDTPSKGAGRLRSSLSEVSRRPPTGIRKALVEVCEKRAVFEAQEDAAAAMRKRQEEELEASPPAKRAQFRPPSPVHLPPIPRPQTPEALRQARAVPTAQAERPQTTLTAWRRGAPPPRAPGDDETYLHEAEARVAAQEGRLSPQPRQSGKGGSSKRLARNSDSSKPVQPSVFRAKLKMIAKLKGAVKS